MFSRFIVVCAILSSLAVPSIQAQSEPQSSRKLGLMIGGSLVLPLRSYSESDYLVSPGIIIGGAARLNPRVTLVLGGEYFRLGKEEVAINQKGGERNDILIGLHSRFQLFTPEPAHRLSHPGLRQTHYQVLIGCGIGFNSHNDLRFPEAPAITYDNHTGIWGSAGFGLDRDHNDWLRYFVDGRLIIINESRILLAVITAGVRLW